MIDFETWKSGLDEQANTALLAPTPMRTERDANSILQIASERGKGITDAGQYYDARRYLDTIPDDASPATIGEQIKNIPSRTAIGIWNSMAQTARATPSKIGGLFGIKSIQQDFATVRDKIIEDRLMMFDESHPNYANMTLTEEDNRIKARMAFKNQSLNEIESELQQPSELRKAEDTKDYPQLSTTPKWSLSLDPPRGNIELATDIGAGIAAFTIKALTVQKMFPGLSQPLVWELVTQSEGQRTGSGAAMSLLFGGSGKISKAVTGGMESKVAKAGITMGIPAVTMGGLAAVEGGSTEEILIQAGIGAMFGGIELYHGRLNNADELASKIEQTQNIPPVIAEQIAKNAEFATDPTKTDSQNKMGVAANITQNIQEYRAGRSLTLYEQMMDKEATNPVASVKPAVEATLESANAKTPAGDTVAPEIPTGEAAAKPEIDIAKLPTDAQIKTVNFKAREKSPEGSPFGLPAAPAFDRVEVTLPTFNREAVDYLESKGFAKAWGEQKWLGPDTPVKQQPSATGTDALSKDMKSPPPEKAVGVQYPEIQGTGEIKQRGLQKSTEAVMIEQGFDALDTAQGYKVRHTPTEKLIEYMNKDWEGAKQVALGRDVPPEGFYPEDVYTAVLTRAVERGTAEDVQFQRDLASTSRLFSVETELGRRIQALNNGLDKAENPVVAMRDIIVTMEEAYQKRTGEKAGAAKTRLASEMKKKMDSAKITHNELNEFIASIVC